MAPVPAVALLAATAWVVLISEPFAGGAAVGHGHLCGIDDASLAGLAAFMLQWSVMVAAMMLPDLAVDMRQRRGPSNASALALFLSGFFVVWEIFGCLTLVVGGIAQRALDAAGVRSGPGDAGGAALLGLVAVALCMSARYGVRQSQSPLDRAPQGALGFRTGLSAGAESLRCCWGIMALMMAAKLHDPLSVAAFALLVAYVRRGRFGISAARLVGVAALADAVVALTLRTSPL